MRLDRLSVCLWDEQAALEELAFRLDEELLVLTSGRHQWLTRATAEVALALSRLGEVERRRTDSARELAEELGLSGVVTLKSLAEAAEPDDARTLSEHRDNLLHLLGLVQELAERNRAMIASNLAATTDALACIGAAPVSAYNSAGVRNSPQEHFCLLDAKV